MSIVLVALGTMDTGSFHLSASPRPAYGSRVSPALQSHRRTRGALPRPRLGLISSSAPQDIPVSGSYICFEQTHSINIHSDTQIHRNNKQSKNHHPEPKHQVATVAKTSKSILISQQSLICKAQSFSLKRDLFISS